MRPLTKDLRSSVTPNFSSSCGVAEGGEVAAEVAAEAMAANWGGIAIVSEKDLIWSAWRSAADLRMSAFLEASAASSFDFLAVSETRSAIREEEGVRDWDFFAASSAKVFARFHRSSIATGGERK